MSVSPIPAYSMVDLNKKKEDRRKAESADIADCSHMSNESALEGTYTRLSQETLITPDCNRYENHNIRNMIWKSKLMKSCTSTQRVHYAVTAFVTLIILITICSGFIVTARNISELRANMGGHLMNIFEHLGQPSSPAPSCAALLAFSPSTPSGHYWVRAGNGSAVRVYCDMTRLCGGVTGGWMRVTYFDFSNSSTPCSSGLRERIDSGIRTCGIQSFSPTCASVLFSTGGIMYNKVCGKILAYQVGITNAFGINHYGVMPTIEYYYVDGVSLTHGRKPRKHIWTFAAARNAVGTNNNGDHVCECSYNPGHQGKTPPSYVGQDYFCDSGSSGHLEESRDRFYSASPLWDGSGCGPNSTCCSFNNPPWFYRQLPSPTSDAIEMRVCSDEERDNEDIAMSSVELLVQ